MKFIYILSFLFISAITSSQLLAQCTGGCPSGSITNLPNGSIIVLAPGATWCISTTTDYSNSSITINGTLVIQAGTVTLQDVTLNKTGVIMVKFGAKLIIKGTFTGNSTAPVSTIDNLIICNGGFLNITGSFSQGQTNIAVNDFGVMQVTGAWTAGATGASVKIGNGSLIELCSSFNLNKDGFFTETSTGVSYLVVHAPMMQSIVNGYLSASQNASHIKFTAEAGAAFISHPAAFTCNACGNFNLAPPGTTSSCGSAADAQHNTVLPVTIKSFYGKVAGEQFQITGVIDNAMPVLGALLEYSTDGRQFAPTSYEPVLTHKTFATTCTFTLPLQESRNFYRLRIMDNQQIYYSQVLLPPGKDDPNALLVYPNPAHNFIIVQMPFNHSWSGMRIINQTGELVYQKNITAPAGLTKYQLPAQLKPGMYFLQFTGREKTLVMRLIKR